MVNFTEKRLSICYLDGLPFVRIDLYESYGSVYFGEMTFFPAGGFDNLIPETDVYFGDLLQLEKSTKTVT